MSETTEEFMDRFRATGLDMLCAGRRRQLQDLPQVVFWGRTEHRWSMPGPNLQQIPKDEVWDQQHKPFRDLFLDHWLHRPGPYWRLIDFDYSSPLAETTVTGRVQDQDRRLLHAALDQQRSVVVMKSRSMGLSYLRQSLAADMMAHGLDKITLDLEALGDAFGTASQSMGDWVSSFGVRPYRPEPLPQPQSLGPGKEVETPNERRYDSKRIAKDRLKKKLARKSKRK